MSLVVLAILELRDTLALTSGVLGLSVPPHLALNVGFKVL